MGLLVYKIEVTQMDWIC